MGRATCGPPPSGGSSVCGTRCLEGWADCSVVKGASPVNCSVNLLEDPTNCGACGNVCPGPVDGPGQAICVAGACEIRCAEGHLACPLGDRGAKICIDPKSNPDHCGACGSACSDNNAEARVCEGGTCHPRCISGFGDCDTVQNNGCETPLNTADQCGACGQSCSSQNVARMCSVAPYRPIPTDVCAAGVCSSGFADCNGDKRLDGCEADLTSILTCGSCGNRCPAPYRFLATCEGGRCGGRCEEDYASCNGPDTDHDGCETHAAFDSGNCGACGNKCPARTQFNNFSGDCSYSRCTCADRGYDCDGDYSNGCQPCDP
jgi:hypothetical protein